MSENLQVIPVEECQKTVYGGGQTFQQWAKTPAGCIPSGPGWTAPIIGRTDDEWLWCRPFDLGSQTPIVHPLDDTQPVNVAVNAPQEVTIALAS